MTIPADKNNALYFGMGLNYALHAVSSAPELTDPTAGLDPHTVAAICQVLIRASKECDAAEAQLAPVGRYVGPISSMNPAALSA